AILVIDKRNRVADYNPACQAMLKLDQIIIGQSVKEVLNHCAIRPELINEIKNGQEEISFTFGTETKIYDFRILPLFNKTKKLCGHILHFRDVTDKRLAEIQLEKTVVDLRRALTEVKTLTGLLPICSNCKKIRDDTGYWKDVETYISQHSTAEFSHGICPDCMQKLYPEQYETLVKKGKISAKSDNES
ncbi:MAG TPA: PAS domain-containing protein, partial [Candidatus Marinimicrobia bacterium]|nr:PAS domain-containing protein [Candidatus Neomarinimicrobiota bacterium]